MLAPLRDFKAVSVGDSLRLFERPGHKDRYRQLVDYLASHPDLYAQLVYLFLLAPDGDLFDLPDATNSVTFSPDDRLRFCYCTVPASFNFCLTALDCDHALRMIDSVLKLHFYFRKLDLAASHDYLEDLVFGFFLATNPGAFFENAVIPLLPSLTRMISSHDVRYGPAAPPPSDSIDALPRLQYWQALIVISRDMLGLMKRAIPLLPSPVRDLIRRIGSIEAGSYPLVERFVFLGLFCGYITNFVPFERPEVLVDLVHVFRCHCSQEYCPDRFFSTLSALLAKDSASRLSGFFDALLDARHPIEPLLLTEGFALSGRHSIVTSRDMGLILRASHYLVAFADSAGISGLQPLVAGLLPPVNPEDDEKFLLFEAWSSDTPKIKLSQRESLPIDEALDAMNAVSIESLGFEDLSELSEKVRKLGGGFLSVTQRMRIEAEPRILTHDDRLLADLRSDCAAARQRSESFLNCLCFVNGQKEQLERTLDAIRSDYTRKTVLPGMAELWPSEFLVRKGEIDSPCKAITRVLESVGQRLNSLSNPLSAEGIRKVRNASVLALVDQYQATQRRLNPINPATFAAQFMSHGKNSHGLVSSMGKCQQAQFSQVILLLMNVNTCDHAGYYLEMLIRAMKMAGLFDNDLVAFAISQSANAELVIVNELLIKILFPTQVLVQFMWPREDWECFQRFSVILKAILRSTT
jgi:hypothetical protein